MARNYKPIERKLSRDKDLFGSQYVDVIIPFHARYEKVAKLINTLIYQTRTNPFRICLVDDASPNTSFIADSFTQIPNLKAVRTSEQVGFGAALEYGVNAMAQEPNVFPWLVFMHSDCVIEDPNWLLRMGQTMQVLKKQGVKMVGSRTNCSGVDDPELKAILETSREAEKEGDVVLEGGQYLPLYCTLCHRTLFDRIGGFVKHYPYCGYEDRELADRMRKCGYKQAVSGKSWVYHEGGATVSYLRGVNSRVDTYIENNRNFWLRDIGS
jgi:GT2 family glycosyltransferase